jgi:hypothetical protein
VELRVKDELPQGNCADHEEISRAGDFRVSA